MKLLRSGKRAPLQDIRGFFHGTVVDRVMRSWLESPDLPEGGMVTLLAETVEREEALALSSGDGVVRWKHAGDKAELVEFCRDLLVRLEPILRSHVTPYAYEPAKRFRTPVTIPYLTGSPTTVVLVGEMDLLVRDFEDAWHVWDLKATRDDTYWRKTIGQLVFYDLAVYSMFGSWTASTGLIQPMCKQQVLPMAVTDQQRREMMQRIVAMAHAIWRRDWTPTEDSAPCAYCPVKHACPKFTPVERAGVKGARVSLVSRPVSEAPEPV